MDASATGTQNKMGESEGYLSVIKGLHHVILKSGVPSPKKYTRPFHSKQGFNKEALKVIHSRLQLRHFPPLVLIPGHFQLKQKQPRS